MAYYTDLMEMKNDTARKNAIRERIATVIEKAMIEEFGAENVRRMKNTIADNRNFKDIYTFVGRYNFESIDKCFCATGKRLEKLAAFYSDTLVIKL